jgi:hypothetical protein
MLRVSVGCQRASRFGETRGSTGISLGVVVLAFPSGRPHFDEDRRVAAVNLVLADFTVRARRFPLQDWKTVAIEHHGDGDLVKCFVASSPIVRAEPIREMIQSADALRELQITFVLVGYALRGREVLFVWIISPAGARF